MRYQPRLASDQASIVQALEIERSCSGALGGDHSSRALRHLQGGDARREVGLALCFEERDPIGSVVDNEAGEGEAFVGFLDWEALWS